MYWWVAESSAERSTENVNDQVASFEGGTEQKLFSEWSEEVDSIINQVYYTSIFNLLFYISRPIIEKVNKFILFKEVSKTLAMSYWV